MQKEAAGGRVSFELMGNSKSQEWKYSFLHSSIWRTVSFQSLPKKVLLMRNILLVVSVVAMAIDCFDGYLYAKDFQYYNQPGMKSTPMMYQGMIRDWLAFCMIGSLCFFFGTLWLCKEMLMGAITINFVLLPAWTSAILYLRYNYKDLNGKPSGNKFFTWWYFAVVTWQFFGGLATIYLYAWLKTDLEARNREENVKLEQGKIEFPRECFSIVAYPCMCKLWDGQKDEVIKRYNNLHEIDVRANIMCPSCQNRIDFIVE